MNELLPKVDVFADLYENNPTYRAFSKIVGRNKLLSPRNRRCGFDIVRHAPPPNLLLEWQQDVHMQVRNAPQTNDFSVTHSPHKRWIAEAESIACPRPPPFDFNDPEFRMIDSTPLLESISSSPISCSARGRKSIFSKTTQAKIRKCVKTAWNFQIWKFCLCENIASSGSITNVTASPLYCQTFSTTQTLPILTTLKA